MNIDKYSHVCGGVPGRRLNVKPGVSPTTQVVSRQCQSVSGRAFPGSRSRYSTGTRSSGSCPRQGLAQIPGMAGADHSGR